MNCSCSSPAWAMMSTWVEFSELGSVHCAFIDVEVLVLRAGLCRDGRRFRRFAL